MKINFKKFGVLLSFVFLSHFAFAVTPEFRDGDIIGESEISSVPMTSFFEAATASRYGHVAVVLKVNNNWVVYEETPPKAQVSSLQSFLNRSPGPYSIIRRHQLMTAAQLNILKSSAQEIVNKGVPYNHSQTQHDGFLNCSEFVRLVFSKAGIAVGKLERVQDLNLKTFHGYPWQLWLHLLPATKLTDLVVTPASVMRTSGWAHVAGTSIPSKKYSDQELVEAWKKENGLNGVASLWRLKPEEIEKLARP